MEFSSQSLSPLLKSNFPDRIAIGSNTVPLRLVRNARARRYLLRLNPDLSVRLTVPRGGSISEAHAFLQRNLAWLERTARRVVARPNLPKQWLIGSSIYWRGELVPIGTLPAEADSQSRFAQFGSEVVCVPRDHSEDLRPLIERHIWALARKELPPIVASHAELHHLTIQRVTVRDQRSRWGSCSRRGVISLNWRILQAPTFVRDYLILHELMHLREMNHSRCFWGHVAAACPNYRTADAWLSQHSLLLSR